MINNKTYVRRNKLQNIIQGEITMSKIINNALLTYFWFVL